jgi:hypothetical protein
MLRGQQRINRSTEFTLIAAPAGNNMRTHEDKDAVCILLPPFGHFFVFSLCHLDVHMKEGARAIGKAGLCLRGLVLLWPGDVTNASYGEDEFVDKARYSWVSNNILILCSSGGGSWSIGCYI